MLKIPALLFAVLGIAAAADSDWSGVPAEELVTRYGQLRGVALDPNQTASLENAVLSTGGAEFRFKSGTLHLFQPVGGRVAGAVFVGEGTLALTPPSDFERLQIRRFLDGQSEVSEPFTEAVFLSTGLPLSSFTAGLNWKPDAGALGRAASALAGFRDRFRDDRRRNIWARTAAGLCSDRASLFLADVHGSKHGRFLFIVDGQFEDEVNLSHYSGREVFDAWTVYGLPGGASLKERAFIDTIHTKLDVTVERSKRLGGSAEIEFTALAGGPRMLLVQLAPSLRVSRISSAGADLKFIQEEKKKDGDLWVVLPKPLVAGEKHVWNLAYAGDDVVHSEGNGNFYVGRRTSWYPKLDVPGDLFNDRAVYQMRFHSPKNLTLVATGKLVKRAVEGKSEVTDWDTVVPYTVVGFNFGEFKSKSVAEGAVQVAAFANLGQNDALSGLAHDIEADPIAAREEGLTVGGLNTSGMIDSMLAEARNSVRAFSTLFGPLPFSAVSVTQQPAANYGQSWPTLVFMPFTAFLDATMKNQLRLNQSRGSRQFFEHVGPHEVAHQWWGHLVAPKADRDTWLSEGFAEYSAGLFVQMAKGEKSFRSYLDYLKEEITSPLPHSTMKAYEAGPISLGTRLESEKSEGAYQRIVYAKGAYVLHMLRMMTHDYTRHDDGAFLATMREFASTYSGREASTEDFQAIVSKRLNGDIGWFFNQWVHGAEYPRVSIQYSVTPNEKGALFHGTISQRGVSKSFVSLIPVRMTLGKGSGVARLVAQGESTPFSVQLPAAPDNIEFNPLQAWLCDLEVKKL